jgi:UDP-N-acetylglucosamine 2-epimerase (non-hydrolysing)
MTKVLVVFGTRPEAIKLAPVVRALEAAPGFEPVVCVTGQHRAMLDQMLGFFGMDARHDLDVMQPDQALTALAARTLERLQPVLDAERPDWLMVQGDTTTAMAAALAAFYNRIRVAHVEAGLRTRDKRAPYPEEVNRRMIGAIADLHLAPTEIARAALLAEGEPPGAVTVTGNTGIDALYWTRDRVREGKVAAPEGIDGWLEGRRLVLVTAHRRENFDGGLAEICAAIRALVERFEDIAVVLPVHPNPNVKGPIEQSLSGIPRVRLTAPVDYGPFVWLLDRATLILTDSGGIQEEATALGKPMLVMRDVTERPEAISSGNGLLVGAHQGPIVEHASRLLGDPKALAAMSRPSDVFGDGRASERIVEALAGSGGGG